MIRRLLCCFLVLTLVTGCSSWQGVRVPALEGPGMPVPEPLGLRTPDGRKVTLANWTIDGDSLRGTREVWVEYERTRQPHALALADVELAKGRVRGAALRAELERRQARMLPQVAANTHKLPKRVHVLFADGGGATLLNASIDADSLRGVVVTEEGLLRPVAYASRTVRAIESRQLHGGHTAGLLLILGVLAASGFLVLYSAAMGD